MFPKPALLLVITGGLLYILGQYIASGPAREEQAIQANREITVQGTGEVVTVPTIANITLSAQTGPQKTAEVALTQLSTTANNILSAVKTFNIDKKDITTQDLSINPVYDYAEGRQTLRGFEVRESIVVTIRDLEKVGEVVASATAQGVSQVGGIDFTVENKEELATQAEEKAIADAKEKAQRLAKELGATLGEVKSYNANSSAPGPVYKTLAFDTAEAVGGVVPPIEQGSTKTTAVVTIVFELR